MGHRVTFGDDRNQHWNLRAGAGIKRKTKTGGESEMRIPLFTAHQPDTVGLMATSSAAGPLFTLRPHLWYFA